MKDKKYLFPINKIPYLKSKKSTNRCIFCELLKGSADFENLIIFSNEIISLTLNLYPYNPAHLMIFPNRHIEDIRELNKDEELEIMKFTKKSMNMIDDLYQPGGYNLGYNIGETSGASINHLHMHIVPRFPNELGFIDVISGSKIIVEDPQKTMLKLKKAIKKYI